MCYRRRRLLLELLRGGMRGDFYCLFEFDSSFASVYLLVVIRLYCVSKFFEGLSVCLDISVSIIIIGDARFLSSVFFYFLPRAFPLNSVSSLLLPIYDI
jgi:hypothetical protein